MDASARTLSLPALVDRAARALAGARTAAEILEARDRASAAYSMAKIAARLEKAKKAHDSLVAAAHRAQADALEIEAAAKRRIADEYDAAQERGEVVGAHDGAKKRVPNENAIFPATAADLGLSRKDIHEARLIRDAEKAEPGIVRRTVEAAIASGKEPTRAAVKSAAKAIARPRLISHAEERRIALAEKISAAVSALASLPSPDTAASEIRGLKAAAHISAKITKAEKWLSCFATNWKE